MLKQNKISPAKAFLQELRNLDAEIFAEREKLESNREHGLTVKYQISVQGKNTGGKENVSEKALVAASEAQRKIDGILPELIEKKREAEVLINKIKDGKLRTLIKCRYILGETWYEVADRLGVTEDYAKGHLRYRAIREIERILNVSQNNTL